MPCDMLLKVMCIGLKRPCQDCWKIVKQRERWTNGQTKKGHLMHLLQHTIPNKSPQGHKDEKAKPKSWSLTFFNTTLSLHLFVFLPSVSFCLFHSPLPASALWSGGRQCVSALTQTSLQELLWLAVLCSTIRNRLKHGELPLTAFLCCSCGFDTVT